MSEFALEGGAEYHSSYIYSVPGRGGLTLLRRVTTRSKAVSQLLQLPAERAEITAQRLLEALDIA